MSRGSMERPVELAPTRMAALLAEGRGEIRLVMNPQPRLFDAMRAELAGALTELGIWSAGHSDAELLDVAFREGVQPYWRCPWGRPGDVLWCRELHARDGNAWRYAALEGGRDVGVVWVPPVRMPREATRLVLRIEDVGIGEADCAFAWALAVEVVR